MYWRLQWVKDFCAVPVFMLMSLENQPQYFLAAFFSLGCFIDTLYTSYAYLYEKPWTFARLKDLWGAFGMWVFTLTLLMVKKQYTPERWAYFFYFAAVVDTLSVFSILSKKNNIYLKLCV